MAGHATVVPDAAAARAAVSDGIGDRRDHAAGGSRSAAAAAITSSPTASTRRARGARSAAVARALAAAATSVAGVSLADHRAHDAVRDAEQRPDHELRAGDRRVLRLLLRLHPDRRELPAGTDGRDARAADGDAGDARRGRHRVHPRLRAVRDAPGRAADDLGARERARAGHRAAARLLGRPRDPDRGQPDLSRSSSSC